MIPTKSKMFHIGFWLTVIFQLSQCLDINFFPGKELTVHMEETVNVYYNITDGGENLKMNVWSNDENVVQVKQMDEPYGSNGTITLNGIFLGITNVTMTVLGTEEKHQLIVKVIRENRAIDKAFTGSVATLVSIIYINFGSALNLQELKHILKRPIGPCIGLVGQFLAMPLLSYGLGYIFFPDRPDMHLGLLFVGVSPAGGASNIWTVVLDGNIDLSVTMTTVSTLAAFGMMPLWLFTLGRHVFTNAHLTIPYARIASLAAALIIPLAIGMGLQKLKPSIAHFLARSLKICSAVLIAFIIIFATITNIYIFSLFNWQIVVAGLALPFCGYIFGWILGKWITRQSTADSLAIAIETGVQNTGIAIFLLQFGLEQPQADLTTVVPVAVAIMTPFPLIILWIVKRFWKMKKDDLPKLSEISEIDSH